MQASVVSAPGLRCCVACGIFPDQGSNLCQEMLNHWTIRDAPGLYFLTLNFEIILPKSFEDNWAFLVAQLVKNPSAKKKKKNPPAMWETRVGKILWRREWLPTPILWPGEFHQLYSPWGHKQTMSRTQPSDFHFHFTFSKSSWTPFTQLPLMSLFFMSTVQSIKIKILAMV